MENAYIKMTFIIFIIIVIYRLVVTCKKIILLIRFNKKGLSCRIIQPDIKMILPFVIYLLGLIALIIMEIRLIYLGFGNDGYELYGKSILMLNMPPLSFFLLTICNEFFPTIVTTEYICLRCEKIYQKYDVTYNYDKEKIFLFYDTNRLIIKTNTKNYNLLIRILSKNYKRFYSG